MQSVGWATPDPDERGLLLGANVHLNHSPAKYGAAGETRLAMATRLAARGLRWDDRIGSIEAGKQGDLVLIPADDWRYLLNPRPLEGFLALGSSHDVRTVVVGGRVVVDSGCLQGARPGSARSRLSRRVERFFRTRLGH